MRNLAKLIWPLASFVPFLCMPGVLRAQAVNCPQLPDHEKLKETLTAVVKQGQKGNGGMGNPEWAVVVNRDGIVCAVTFSGPNRQSQWLGSRIIAASKANTANAFSLQDYALSTGNLYAASQPGQSLYGIASSPPDPAVAYAGPAANYGEPNDPMVGKPVGGVIVFGGGLPLYTPQGALVGGLGVSGDTACADHVVAWKVRHDLRLDGVPMGPAPGQSDNLIFDIQNGLSASGFGHPECKGGLPSKEIIENLPKIDPTGPKHLPR
jgi:uncharacterized protein GlcG (DUF336 family)